MTNLVSFSTTRAPCWPSKDAYLTNGESGEVAARYLGLPSPACRGHIGASIGASRAKVDAFGDTILPANLPGDGWREQHDTIKWKIRKDSREMGVSLRGEVYCLFAAHIPAAGRDELNKLPSRKRQGLVPDLMLHAQWDGVGPERDILLELKTLHFGASAYPLRDAARCAGVARRAAKLPADYASQARRVDRTYCGSANGEVGPVEAKLRQFDPVCGIVFSSWGEASKDAHALLEVIATAGAKHHVATMWSESVEVARSGLIWMLRRRCGLAALRASARLLLARLCFVRPMGRAADDTSSRALRASCWARRGPR